MKFITEEDLRNLYKIKPFTSYEIEQGTRLTPGARQFLADRGMNLFDGDFCVSRSDGGAFKTPSIPLENKSNRNKKRLCSRINSMEAMFLLAGEGLLEKDLSLARSVIELCGQLRCVRNVIDGKPAAETLSCKECTGIKADTFSDDLDDCFEVTELLMQLEKSNGILTLHKLRCALRELEADLPELCGSDSEENKVYEKITERFHQMINTLSQLICVALGGKECQRKA